MHMSFTRAYTQRELDFIRANWKKKSAREIASELGRSERGIYKKIRDMHLREQAPDGGSPPMQSDAKIGAPMQSQGHGDVATLHRAPTTDRERLAGLRDLIWASLAEAGPADVARLAPEYRKTLEEMGRLDERDAGRGHGSDDALADIISL